MSTSSGAAGSRNACRAFVALGANLADPKGNVLRAIQSLQQLSDQPIVASGLWETDPVDCPPDSPKFVNAVVAVVPRPGETAESLLNALQGIERAFGRSPKKMVNEARPLDLDLIAFEEQTRFTSTLTLPHPRAHLRRFVLQPLAEIAPDFILPGQTKTVAQLLADLPPDPGMRQV